MKRRTIFPLKKTVRIDVWVILSFNQRANAMPSRTTHHTSLEVAWTVVPIAILVFIAVPSFRLLFLEHVRSDDPARARLQDRLNWLNRIIVCCDCNRATLGTIRQAGFTVTQLEHTAMPKSPKFVRPAIMGVATTPS